MPSADVLAALDGYRPRQWTVLELDPPDAAGLKIIPGEFCSSDSEQLQAMVRRGEDVSATVVIDEELLAAGRLDLDGLGGQCGTLAQAFCGHRAGQAVMLFYLVGDGGPADLQFVVLIER